MGGPGREPRPLEAAAQREPGIARQVLQARRLQLRGGRPLQAARSGLDAGADRRGRRRRLLQGRDRPPHRRRHGPAQRPDHHGRPGQLPRGRARAGARHLPRLRHRGHVRAQLRRDAHRPDAEHLRELPPEGDGLRQRGRHARHGRVDEARVRRPQQVSGRPGPSRPPGRRTHQQGLRGRAGAGHLPQQRPSVIGHRAGQPGPLREPGDHALLHPGQRGQRAGQHLHADVLLRLGRGDRGHGHPHEQQPRQLHPAPGHPRRLRADGERGQPDRGRPPPGELHDPDHRAARRTALPAHRQPGRKPHHHHQPAAAGERARARHEHRRRHRASPHAPPVVSGPAGGRERLQPRCDPRAKGPRPRRAVQRRDGEPADRDVLRRALLRLRRPAPAGGDGAGGTERVPGPS